jgi:hypothetical protein
MKTTRRGWPRSGPALAYVLQPPPAGFSSWEEFLTAAHVPQSEWNSPAAAVDPDEVGPRPLFQRVPEPKTTKNRVHPDVNAAGAPGTPEDECRSRVDATVARLVAAGATVLRDVEQRGERWVVMQDPEG